MYGFLPEQARIVWTLLCSTFLAIVAPTGLFMGALTMACMFNIWAGMRADGVSLIRCRNFSWGKFVRAMYEFVVILAVIELIRGIMYLCGDDTASLYPVKILTYTACFIYVQNALKNLVKAYPKNRMLWVTYLFVRFEWRRAMPAHVDTMVEQYEQHLQRQKEDKEKESDESKHPAD